MADAQRICKELGVKFAYNLDGGGSTQTVYGKKIVNSIYEGTTGRKRGTFIVFNGTSQYDIPNS
jgi:exopolysaccharide biosynthesis protein